MNQLQAELLRLADRTLESADGHASDGLHIGITGIALAEYVANGQTPPTQTWTLQRTDGRTVHFFRIGGDA